MEMATNEARSALQRVADDMACFYDIHGQHAPTYKVGDKVWLNAQNIITTQPTKKLDHKWLGPYTVDKVISHNAYRLQLPSSFDCTHLVFSTILLQPYEEDPIHERRSPPPPPPVIWDGVQEFEVKKILGSQVFQGRLEYLVRWKAYYLWIPAKEAAGAKRCIAEFHKQNPETPKHISAATYVALPFQPIENFMEPTKRVLFDWTLERTPNIG